MVYKMGQMFSYFDRVTSYLSYGDVVTWSNLRFQKIVNKGNSSI